MQVRLQSLPRLICKISGRFRRSASEWVASFCANRFIPISTATAFVTTSVVLIALETFALFSFERFDSQRAKLDSLNRPPRLGVAFQNLNSVKAGVRERGD